MTPRTADTASDLHSTAALDAASSIANPSSIESTSSASPVEEHPATIDRAARRERMHHVLGRIAYWAPVFVALVLFGQVSFLGLRPALAEAGRLEDAEGVLATRHESAVAHNTALMSHLAARNDPIFLERQRRQRAWAATPGAVQAQTPIVTRTEAPAEHVDTDVTSSGNTDATSSDNAVEPSSDDSEE